MDVLELIPVLYACSSYKQYTLWAWVLGRNTEEGIWHAKCYV